VFQIQKTKQFWLTALIAAMAAFVYNSWPLGYWLNPAVSRRGLASELEALHQPYNWVFILLDVLSGLLVAAVSILMWQRGRSATQKLLIINFALFGIFTLVDALLPLSCDPSLRVCPSLSHQPLLILHGIFSITASVCLFISVALAWFVKRNQRGSFIMSTLMVGWTLFGVLSLYFFFVPGPGYLAQHYYITLCSLWVLLLPFMVTMPKAARAKARFRS
jgi:hypothetical protein